MPNKGRKLKEVKQQNANKTFPKSVNVNFDEGYFKYQPIKPKIKFENNFSFLNKKDLKHYDKRNIGKYYSEHPVCMTVF